MPSADELSPRGEKREAEEEEEESSEDEMVGPSIQDAAPLKKKRVLEYEKVYLGNLFWFSPSIRFSDPRPPPSLLAIFYMT